jgi:diguanylate cyclase (GGDEF)-like protein
MADRARQGYSLRLRVSLAMAAVLACTGALLVVMVHRFLTDQALAEASAKARLLLDHNLAIHSYFNHQLKPSLFRYLEDMGVSEPPFDPAWMSSTYAVREIQDYFRELNDAGYYYKECAVSARSPRNEADISEADVLEACRKDNSLAQFAGVRDIEGIPNFVLLRRGESMEQSCLRCHDTPERAPAGLVERYGAERSFYRRAGELVSAPSLRIPLKQAYAEADHLSARLSLLMLAALVVLFTVQLLALSRYFFRPLRRVRQQAQSLTTDPGLLGASIPLPEGRELRGLVESFNAMSSALAEDRQELEGRVTARTEELRQMNERLQIEVEQRRAAQEQLRHSNEQLEALSMQDGLTGVANRRAFDRHLAREWSRAMRRGASLGLLMVDVDHFKAYNDRYGHLEGDDCLRKLAQTMAMTLKRPGDLFARYGGEEFAVVLAETTEEGAARMAERMRSEVAALGIPHDTSPVGPRVTVSVGVACAVPQPVSTPAALVQRADDALYSAKQEGRDRVVMGHPPTQE